jgi:DNA-binding PadR family transcriptional regulator
MSYRLVILGILAEQPQYGYELKQTIARQHFAGYIRLSGGGLYYHLRKLREEGYLEEDAVEHEGNYPDRHIYRLTPRGRRYLIDLVRATLSDAAERRVYDPLDAALSFAHLVSREEVLARLQHQLDTVSGQLAALSLAQQLHRQVLKQTAEQASNPAKSESLYAQLVIDHNLARLQEEGRWLQKVIHHIEGQSDFEGQHFPSITAAAGEEAQALASDPALTRAYEIFEEKLTRATEALAIYHRQLDLAWQTYEQQVASRGSDGELQEARRRYQQRVRELRQGYEAAVGSGDVREEPGAD